MDQVKIGRFLKILRKEKGLTQEQLAEKFNVAGRTISRWETGSNMPDLMLICKLFNVLKFILYRAIYRPIFYIFELIKVTCSLYLMTHY